MDEGFQSTGKTGVWCGTWIGLHDERGVVEVAVPRVPAAVGVVEVHGDGGAGHEAVRVVARPAFLDHGAAHLGARVVQVLRQDLVRRRRLGDAPGFLQVVATQTADPTTTRLFFFLWGEHHNQVIVHLRIEDFSGV